MNRPESTPKVQKRRRYGKSGLQTGYRPPLVRPPGQIQVITRRFLLGYGVSASFLLPAVAGAASPRVTRPPPRALPLVLLDPGHGGKDPGAIGISGTYEKHIALAAAEDLRRQLVASGRYRVELTRTRDVFVPLEDRVGIAQKHGAALFVSMHADALRDPRVSGASVYTLADTASDAQTAALAQRENAADRFGVRGLHDTPPEVARILASLVRQETRAGSAKMARDVVTELHHDTPLLTNPSRHAGFVVLKAADIPSVLVEMGFMSNRADEAALRRPDHRAHVAAAMKRAIDTYFSSGPGGTLTARRMAG
jgi:N-acetylmuramoyl-L-alanine amidase